MNFLRNDLTESNISIRIVWVLTALKVSKCGDFSGPYFPEFGLEFSPNTGKYGPEITPYLDTFHAVTPVKESL